VLGNNLQFNIFCKPTELEEEIEMEQPLTLIQRRNFMQLPLEERRRIMAQQADKLSEHYNQDQEWRDWLEDYWKP
jgi:hypothetical protein